MPDLMDGIVETTVSRYGYLEVARDSRAERTGGTRTGLIRTLFSPGT